MNCDIIRDLLPLYHDGVCSEGSRRAVEEHLRDCAACRAALEALDAPLPEAARAAANDAAVVEKLSREWERGRRRARAKGMAAAAAVCLALFGGWFAATQLQLFPVPVEKIEITDVRRLSDGRVLYHLYIKDELELSYIDFQDNRDGTASLIPKRELCPGLRRGNSHANSTQVLDIAEENTWKERQNIGGGEITRVYYGQGKNAVLLWEEGMDLPPASAADEERWGYEPGSAEYWAARRETSP